MGRRHAELIVTESTYHLSDLDSVNGIDLIAGNNDEDMQPFVKGQNMADAVSALVDHIQKLTSIVDTLLTWQMKMNSTIKLVFT